ncbi:MAG: response regulator transcription factor [Xanthobacteraceae bacterium]
MSAIALSSLTARQREIVMLAANGLSNKEIARRLGLSEGTVKLHLHNIYTQLGIRNRTALVGLVHTPRPA